MVKLKLSVVMGNRGMRNLSELSRASGLDRRTLTALFDGKSKGIEWKTLDTLCTFFNCSVGDLIEYVAD